jgi:hypothetical protein
MERLNKQVFYPGEGTLVSLPLGRYLPLIPRGSVHTWLANHVEPGAWVIDPLGANPWLAIEAARYGYRVLVCANNPVLCFLLRTLAAAHPKSDFQAVVAALSSSKKGDERLEVLIRNHYRLDCPSCGYQQYTPAFIWKQGDNQPDGFEIHCPHCGLQGAQKLTDSQKSQLGYHGNESLHRSRAMQRLGLTSADELPGVPEVLNSYLPRSLDVLFTILNKQEGLFLTNTQRTLFDALCLSLCDDATTLWPSNSGRTRPRQISTPPQFLEKNLWQAFEEAMNQWLMLDKQVPVFEWPFLPDSHGGICLYPGRLKTILPLPAAIQPSAVVMVIPRPSQAFWSYSAVWSGWVWGKNAITPIRSFLERRRYDWSWHANALKSVFSAIRELSQRSTPLITYLPDVSPGFLMATVVAAQSNGFQMDGYALREEDELLQANWSPQISNYVPLLPALQDTIDASVNDNWQATNQPASYLSLFAEGLFSLSRQQYFRENKEKTPFTSQFSQVQQQYTSILTRSGKVQRFLSQAQDLENGLWWPIEPPETNETTLDDRVEMAVVRYLQIHSKFTPVDLEQHICKELNGWFTPPSSLIQAIMHSYGEPTPVDNMWQTSPGDQTASRKSDIKNIDQILRQLGLKIGFSVEGENPISWKMENGREKYRYYLLASSIISRFVLNHPPDEATTHVLVLPGSRAGLLSQKLERNPYLKNLCAGWKLVKFRHLRMLAERQDLDATLWDTLLDQDPPGWDDATQLAFNFQPTKSSG